MFKIGDKVVFIDKDNTRNPKLELYKKYTVSSFLNYYHKEGYINFYFIAIDGLDDYFLADNFISLRKYRKLKLKKIYEINQKTN